MQTAQPDTCPVTEAEVRAALPRFFNAVEARQFLTSLEPSLRARFIRAVAEQPGDGLLHDPLEDDPKIGPVVQAAGDLAEAQLRRELGELGLGACHRIWEEQAQLLRDRGIEWMSPGFMNPDVCID